MTSSRADDAAGAVNAVLRGALRALRSTLRRCRTLDESPGAFKRAFLVIPFVVAFGAWYLVRMALLATRRTVEVQTRVDFAWPAASPPKRLRCTVPDLIQSYLDLFGTWEPDLVAFLRRRLTPGDGYVDVGANVGAFVLLATERTSGPIVAIDASPRMIARLRENLALNADEPAVAGVRVVHAAVSDERGELLLWDGPAKNVGRSTTVAEIATSLRLGDSVRVPSAALGDLLEPHEIAAARIIKIDVEGAEPAVLRGMLELLPRLRPEVEVMIELSPHWWPAGSPSLDAVLAPFIAAGFHPYELPNVYWPWRYLWPRRVSPPRRVRVELALLDRRLDLVLSRVDAEVL